MDGFFWCDSGFGYVGWHRGRYMGIVWMRHRVRITCPRRVFIGRVRIDY